MEISGTAQMVAVFRSMDEELSGDTLARHFITESGIQIAESYIRDVYPHVVRHLAVRNRYIED